MAARDTSHRVDETSQLSSQSQSAVCRGSEDGERLQGLFHNTVRFKCSRTKQSPFRLYY